MIYLVYLYSFIATLLKLLGVIDISWAMILVPSAIAIAWQFIVVFLVFLLVCWAEK